MHRNRHRSASVDPDDLAEASVRLESAATLLAASIMRADEWPHELVMPYALRLIDTAAALIAEIAA